MKTKLKLKKGDRVQVIQGKDIGKTGEVAHVYPERNMVVVKALSSSTSPIREAPEADSSDDAGRDQDRAMPIPCRT
jgi:large subunit ribosomal protein L24